MLANDSLSDCGPAATEHYRMAKAGSATVTPAATDTYTEDLYFAYGTAQGEPGPQPDQGVDNATWLKWLFDQGLIEAYAELDPSNGDEVRQAMIDFRGVLVGCVLADDAESDFEATPPIPWNLSSSDQPDPNDGHDILLVAYDPNSETFVTWGGLQPATVAWSTDEVADKDLEAWVIITAEDAARSGVDITALQATIRSLGGTVEPPVPGPSPLPSPAPSPGPSPSPQPSPTPSPSPSPSILQEIRHDIEVLEEDIEEWIDEGVTVEQRYGAGHHRGGLASASPVDANGVPLGIPIEHPGV
jgi:hypothetical protein